MSDQNTTTEPKRRTITLTGRPPVRIREDHWPVIAHGSYDHHDGQVRSQANRIWRIDIRVRQHQDGRAVVYGVYDYDTTHFARQAGTTHKAGVLLTAAGDDLPAAIQIVAAQLIDRVVGYDRHIRDVANECIADLPPEELDA